MADGLSGIGTGMDWGSLIEQSMQTARKPAEQWEKQIELLKLKKEIYEKVSSNFFQLRSSLTQLKLESTYLSKQAELTPVDSGKNAAAIIKVTTKPEATLSNWRINVLETAVAKTYTSTRMNSVSDPLNLEGKFNIFVGQQMAQVTIEKGDNLKEINLKLNKLKDQWGQPVAAEAMLLDNRLVIKSSNSGLDKREVKLGEKLTVSADSVTYLPRTNTGHYPTQLFSVSAGVNKYLAGVHFDYSETDGTITWKSGQKPAEGTEIDLVYADVVKIAVDNTGTTTIPPLLSGEEIKSNTPVKITGPNGILYVDGDHYSLNKTTGVITWNASPPASSAPPSAGDEIVVTLGSDTYYGTNYNETYLEAADSSDILKSLGLETASTAARDAELEVNGVKITRSSNKIDDIIGNTTLELIGKGEVILDINTDAQKAVESTEKFVELYNETLTLINELLEEKLNSQTGNDKDTVFGLFHGDQLLWSLKNQFRNFIMNPVTKLSPTLATKRFASNEAPLGYEGSVFITVGGKKTRLTISKTDTLLDIQQSLLAANNLLKSIDPNAEKKPMPLSVSIKDGQLIISSTSTNVGVLTGQESIKRSAENYDILPFAYTSAPPVNGKISVSTKNKTFYEGYDFDVMSVVSDKDPNVIESRIVWKTGDAPKEKEEYTVVHTFVDSAVAIEPDKGDIIDIMGFYSDTSSSLILHAGISTESVNYGKSGLLEFDSAKMMEAMKEDPKALSALMVTFMRDLDALVGSTVDSSNLIVGGQTVTKGRIASKVNSIDNEITELNKRISTLDRRLKDRQTNLYKKYTEMEKAMAKLNAQLGSMAQFFSQMNSKSNSQ